MALHRRRAARAWTETAALVALAPALAELTSAVGDARPASVLMVG